jgi:tetratricopeptide (TPR) repeat protein
MHDAIDHMRQGRLAEAERLTREVLAEREDMGTAYHYLAFILLEQERVPEAIGVMEASRSRGLASAKLLRQLGLSLAEVGRFEDSVAMLSPLAESGDPRSLHDLASARSEAGDQAGAERALRRILEQDPLDPEAHQTLALVLLRGGDPQSAVAEAQRATELDDQLSLAWSFLGAASHALGDKRRALDAWERAVEIDASNFDALYNITLVADELGETASLRRALERFVATAPARRYSRDIEVARERLRTLSR